MFKKKNEVKQEEAESVVVTDEGEEEVEEKGSFVNTLVNAFLVFAIILAAVATYVSFVSSSGNGVPSILGVRPFSIQTESMYPTLQPGDLIISTAADPDELRVDDIVTYWTVINGERVLNTHRITDIYDGGTHLIFATKGDNNTTADAMTVHESEIVGVYQFRIPGVGKVFDFLQTSKGFFLVIVLPVFLFFIYHLVQFFRVLFEYQNIKNRIKYEQEREITEDLIEQQKKLSEENKKMDRASYEAELREKLKAEIMAEEAKKREKEALEEKIREELKAELMKEVAKAEAEMDAALEREAKAKKAAETVTEEPVEEAETVVEQSTETVEEELAVEASAEETEQEAAEQLAETVDEATEKETTEVEAEETPAAEETTAVETEETESKESVEETAETVTEEVKEAEDEAALREKMIEEELKKREALMLEKLREELKAQLLAEMSEKNKDAE